MSRALTPVALGAFGGSWWYWLRREAAHLAVELTKASLTSAFENPVDWDLESFSAYLRGLFIHFLRLGAFIVLWELRFELVGVARVFLYLLKEVLELLRFLLHFGSSWLGTLFEQHSVEPLPNLDIEPWTERRLSLTCMAAAGVGGPPPYPVGSFLLISRPPSWDEIWIAGYSQGNSEVIGRTTTPDGGQFMWVMVRLVGMAVQPPQVAPDGTRRAPGGIHANSVNWVCIPPDSSDQWEPDPVEVVQLVQEAQATLSQVFQNPALAIVNTAGVGGDLVELVLNAGPVAPGGRRGCGSGQPRGCRAGNAAAAWFKPWRRSRPESIRECHPAASVLGIDTEGRAQKGQEVKEGQENSKVFQEEKEEAFQEIQEVPQLQHQFFKEQSIPQCQQWINFQQQSPSPMEGGWEGSQSGLLRPQSHRSIEAEEERGFDSIRLQTPWGADSSFPGRGVCSLEQGYPQQKWSVERGFGCSMGQPICRAQRGEGHEGGAHVGGDLRQCQQARDFTSFRHFGAEDPCHSDGEIKRGQLGEVRIDRTPQLPEGSCQQFHAGSHQSMREKTWRAWLAMGGKRNEVLGFDSFFTRAAVAMSRGCSGCVDRSTLGVAVQDLLGQLRRGGGKFKCDGPVKGRGRAVDRVFPLSPMSSGGRFLSPVEPGDRLLFHGGNMVIAVLNWMHGGQKWHGPLFLSAAHRRVHSRIERALRDLVMTDDPILSSGGLDSFLKQTEHYRGGSAVLALGAKGGVPSKAADVPLADHLAELFPEMSHQVREPCALLLPSRRRPRRVKRGYTWVASTYPELVKKNVQAGLHRYKKPSQVAKHRGVRCLAGAFAVPKDNNEDRVITDPSVNQLIDPERLPRPSFAYIPHMRCLTVPRGGVIAVSKRDARHYFHRLRLGKKWEKWLCGPPIPLQTSSGETKQFYPAARATPMGFGPSAGWAQGLTDVVTADAKLPPQQRLSPDFVVPEGLPIWGSIIDDIWAIEHVSDDAQPTVGPDWMCRAEQAWVVRGVEPNRKKSVDGALGEEVQGYYVHPQGHWIGVALDKRRFLFQATIMILLQRDVLFGVVERLIGKHGFVHSCRPCMRSVFEHAYTWLDSCRRLRPKCRRVVIPPEVWQELAASAFLLCFAQFDLSSAWSQRVEATDSSMTGLGRSFATMPVHVVQVLARYSSTRGVYTNLNLPWGVNLTKEHSCPLRKVRLPKERVKWSHMGCRWNPSHITLGEADAVVWAAGDRLKRPCDDGCRFVHPLDSVAVTGAMTKGRSSSRALNFRCRQVASINIAGGHDIMYPWIPSADNPADEPSRWFEPAGAERKDDGDHEGSFEPVSECPLVDLRDLPWLAEGAFVFIHLCSGPRRVGDLIDMVENVGRQYGFDIIGIAVDPLADFSPGVGWLSSFRGDLLKSVVGDFLLKLIHSGRVIGGFGSPPCSTISAARYRPLEGGGGPRPLRSRAEPWYPLAYCTKREIFNVQVGTLLYLLCLGLLGEMRMFGAWIGLEHPADRGRDPYASFFNTREVRDFKQKFRLGYWVIHQCMYGAMSKKPTGLLLPAGGSSMVRLCDHRHRHRILAGQDIQGNFVTTAAARYPQQLCHSLAEVVMLRCDLTRSRGYRMPFCPISSSQQLENPWNCGEHVVWSWPQPRSNLFAEYLEAVHNFQVCQRPRAPQQ